MLVPSACIPVDWCFQRVRGAIAVARRSSNQTKNTVRPPLHDQRPADAHWRRKLAYRAPIAKDCADCGLADCGVELS
eukprot:4681132-Alexandrium_andersonii.AAC.1